MAEIGRRIVVYGPAGSGKSTLAQRISQRIGIPHIELDAIFWKPGWVESPLEEFRTEVLDVLNRCADGWVCDGNYSRVRDLTIPLADTVVWWNPPFQVAFWRLLKRTVARCWDGKLLWGINRETWRQSFFSRDSIILYQLTHWSHFKRVIPSLEEIPHRAPVIELRSQKEVDEFLSALTSRGK